MIRYVHGMDIFDHPPTVALVNPVNCRGVMGAGLALEFKKRYPAMFREYARKCKNGGLHPGMLHIWRGERTIVNLPTKFDWRNPAILVHVDIGLEVLSGYIWSNGIAIPKLGCGLGGLHWPDVRALIVARMGRAKYEVWVHGDGD